MTLKEFHNQLSPLRGRMLPVANRMLLQRAPLLAEDAVQEALIRLWSMREGAMRYDSLEALAVTITKNVCIDILRRQPDFCRADEELEGMANNSNPHRELEEKDTHNALLHLIGRLPTLQQAVLRLKDVEGYEVDEIAAITGTQPEAVRMNLSRARRKVKEDFLKLL